MESALHVPIRLVNTENSHGGADQFSSAAVLSILRLIFTGAPLPEVLAIIAQLVESRGDGTLCTLWLPADDRRQLYCAAAPSLPGFIDAAGFMIIGPQGGSCGAAVHRRAPVYVTDIRTDSIWDIYRHRLEPFGIRAVWSQPLFTSDGDILGTFAIHYREARMPDSSDIELIEKASHIAGIAIERHLKEERLRIERDRLRLLLEITPSMTSKLDMRRLIETLSTDLLRVMRCDFCALLLPDGEHDGLRVTVLYNPEARGSIKDGMVIPRSDFACDRAFKIEKAEIFSAIGKDRYDLESLGNKISGRIAQLIANEGLVSGCGLPLLSWSSAIGVLAALSRSERTLDSEEIAFLEQVARQVATAVENALDYEKAIHDRDKEARQKLYLEEEIRAEFGEIVGDSPTLKSALNLVSTVAPTDSSVLILGETGTGKELIARAIHNLSHRRDRPFVKLNCAAIPLGLLESELFGHERGAFTGAIAQKTGRFELANKGTLFLDEVGDIPLELQAKLLRVLQEKEFERLGSNHTHKVDVRLIAATHRDLAGMVKQMTFREDLYYRLKVFPIYVPALRQRIDDIPKLVRHFVRLFAQRMNKNIDEIPSATMETLTLYRWPGNVRELQNFIERAVILSPNNVLRAPASELEPFNSHKTSNTPLSGLEEVERDHILRALDASNWVVGGNNGAAERLGMKRTSLVYKMQRLGISRPVASQQKR